MDGCGWFFLLWIGLVGVRIAGTAKLTGAYATVLNYKTDISVQKNSHLVLDCNIRASSATMRYTWFKDGQELLPQRRLYIAASNGSLIIEKVINKRRKGKSDEGFYECVGDNYIGGRPLGTVIGRRVNITIKRPSFLTIPQNATASVGGVARFHCETNLKRAFYSWHSPAGTQLQLDKSRMTSITGTLQISNITESDAGVYVCQARSVENIVHILDMSVTLTVNTDPLPNTPQFVTTPLHIRVLEGEPAFLECLVESGSQYTLTWYNKDGETLEEAPIPGVYIVGNSNIKITSASPAHNGTYTCVVTHGEAKARIRRVYSLEVLIPPRILKAPKPVYDNQLVQRERLPCIASGYPTPSISWYKDGIKLFPAPTKELKHELMLHGQAEESGFYQCMAENEAGIDIATTYIRFKINEKTPGKPKNVNAIPVSSTEVNVTWSPAAVQSGFEVMAYGVDLHEVHERVCTGKCTHLFDRRREVTAANFVVIEHLKPYTEYTFVVQAFCGRGAGLLSEEVTVRTLEAVPTTNPNIQISPDTVSSFRVTWQDIPIEHRHGVIDRYKLWYGTPQKLIVLELDGDTRTYLVTGLEPDTSYQVRVLAGNTAGYPKYGNKDFWVKYRTPRGDARVLPTPKVSFESVNSTSVLLKWNGDEFSSVKNYRLNVQKLLQSSVVQEINISSKSSDFLLTNLENNTFYRIDFMVKNQEDSVIGIVTELYQSLAPGMAQQPPPPMDVDLQLLTSSIINLAWRKPKTSLKIIKYTVMYRQQVDETNVLHMESASAFVSLEGLSPFTWYVISVQSHSVSTTGPFGKPVIVQTKEGIPSPPENLLGEVVSPGTVRLKWRPPKNQNGIIRFYIIYYNADKTVDDYLWKSIQQNASHNTVVVEDLEQEIYYFKMRACTGAGEGKTSHIIALDTLTCSQMPCPQCQPPLGCTTRPPEPTADNVPQKYGIIIGCGIGVLCIICCVIFIMFYRYSRTAQYPQPVVSVSSSDSTGRYLRQPPRGDNMGLVHYSPIVKQLEENANSDSKGGVFVYVNPNSTYGENMVVNNDTGPIAATLPQSQIPSDTSLPAIERLNPNSVNENADASETTSFLNPVYQNGYAWSAINRSVGTGTYMTMSDQESATNERHVPIDDASEAVLKENNDTGKEITSNKLPGDKDKTNHCLTEENDKLKIETGNDTDGWNSKEEKPGNSVNAVQKFHESEENDKLIGQYSNDVNGVNRVKGTNGDSVNAFQSFHDSEDNNLLIGNGNNDVNGVMGNETMDDSVNAFQNSHESEQCNTQTGQHNNTINSVNKGEKGGDSLNAFQSLNETEKSDKYGLKIQTKTPDESVETVNISDDKHIPGKGNMTTDYVSKPVLTNDENKTESREITRYSGAEPE